MQIPVDRLGNEMIAKNELPHTVSRRIFLRTAGFQWRFCLVFHSTSFGFKAGHTKEGCVVCHSFHPTHLSLAFLTRSRSMT